MLPRTVLLGDAYAQVWNTASTTNAAVHNISAHDGRASFRTSVRGALEVDWFLEVGSGK